MQKNIRLTDREKIGFAFEIKFQDSLDDEGFSHFSNPRDPVEWKRKGCGNLKYLKDVKKSLDHLVRIGSLRIGVESKYTCAKVYDSWIKRDLETRLENSKCDYKIFYVNPEMKLKVSHV